MIPFYKAKIAQGAILHVLVEGHVGERVDVVDGVEQVGVVLELLQLGELDVEHGGLGGVELLLCLDQAPGGDLVGYDGVGLGLGVRLDFREGSDSTRDDGVGGRQFGFRDLARRGLGDLSADEWKHHLNDAVHGEADDQLEHVGGRGGHSEPGRLFFYNFKIHFLVFLRHSQQQAVHLVSL